MLRLDSRPSTSSTTLTIIASALMGLGVVMVFSASASLTAPPITEKTLTNPSVRQAAFTILGLITMLLVGLIPYGFWRVRGAGRKARGDDAMGDGIGPSSLEPRPEPVERQASSLSWFQPPIYLVLISLALLVLVLVPGIGEVRNGARRWLSLGPSAMGLGFQPSELAKLSTVVFLAAVSARMGDRIRCFWTGLLPLVLYLGLVAGLVGIEDFGTAALIALVGGCILLGAGARIWHLALFCLPGIAGVVQLVLSKPYRMVRLMSFLNPEADPQGKGYHQVQSLITIASGGWWGRGLGAGIQKYGYLPEGRSDFIFAVICEELGIIAGVAIIALFAILLWHGRRALLAAPTPFGRLLALGVTLTIGLQAAMNIAVVTVSIPTKGIGLPMVSAGGSGVIFMSVLVGLLVNVARYRPHAQPTSILIPHAPRAHIWPPLGLPIGAISH